jgi:hypothetical protein
MIASLQTHEDGCLDGLCGILVAVAARRSFAGSTLALHHNGTMALVCELSLVRRVSTLRIVQHIIQITRTHGQTRVLVTRAVLHHPAPAQTCLAGALPQS